jgi:hypothetical protein
VSESTPTTRESGLATGSSKYILRLVGLVREQIGTQVVPEGQPSVLARVLRQQLGLSLCVQRFQFELEALRRGAGRLPQRFRETAEGGAAAMSSGIVSRRFSGGSTC